MADVTNIVATTLSDWAKKRTNNIVSRNDYFRHIKGEDERNPDGRKGYRVVGGGDQFKETLFTALNNTFRGYVDRATIDTTETSPFKEAQYPIRTIAGSLNMSKLQKAQNMPAYQIHDLLEAKIEEAEYSMEEILGDSSLSDGTTDTAIPGGLQAVSPTTDTLYGTISGITESFWRPQRDTTGITAWNTANEGLIALETSYVNCSRGQEKPDLIVTTQAIKALVNIMTILNSQLNINMGSEKGQIGYDRVMFHKAEVISDDNVPAQTLYLVNTRHFRFSVLKEGEFKMTKWKEPVDGLFELAQMYVFCNFTCSSRRLQGLMTAITG